MFFLVLLEWVDIYLYLCRCLSHLWLPLHEQNGYSHLFVPLLTWSEDGRQHSSLWDQTFFNRQSGIVATGRGLCVNQCLNESLSSPGGMNGSFHPLHTITHAQQNHTHTHTHTTVSVLQWQCFLLQITGGLLTQFDSQRSTNPQAFISVHGKRCISDSSQDATNSFSLVTG